MSDSPVPARIGRYEIERQLGRGAMGIVYLGRDARLDRRVALKTLAPPAGLSPEEQAEVRHRFLNEGKAAARLNHPAIVSVYDADEDPATGLAWLAMELIEGTELRALIPGGLPRDRLVAIVDDVAAALDHAHARGVIHRDVKPANIIVDAEGRAKLADFGIARLAASTMTQDGSFLGSPAYMSPEQVRGQTVTPKSDIFSLGVIVYECLTGRRPFVGEDLVSTTHAIANEEPERPSVVAAGVSPAVDQVLARALAKDPALRPATATELARQLRAALEAPATARGASPSRRPPPAVLAGGVAALALLVAVVALLARTALREDEPKDVAVAVEDAGRPRATPEKSPAPAEPEPAPREPEPPPPPPAAEPAPRPAATAPAAATTGTLAIELFTFRGGTLIVSDADREIGRTSVSRMEKGGFRMKNPKRRFEASFPAPAGRRTLSFTYVVDDGRTLRQTAVQDVPAGGTLRATVDIGTLARDIDLRFR